MAVIQSNLVWPRNVFSKYWVGPRIVYLYAHLYPRVHREGLICRAHMSIEVAFIYVLVLCKMGLSQRYIRFRNWRRKRSFTLSGVSSILNSNGASYR
jgi:hypothetical protein